MSPASLRRQPSPHRRAFHARALAAATLLGACALPSAQAATCTWNGTSGNWNALANWINCVTGNGSPAGVPGAADSASIGAAGVVAVTNAQAANALSNAGTINIASSGSLRLNAAGGGTSNSGTVNVASGGVLTFDGRSFAHAISGGGSFVLAGGTLRMEGANTTTLAAGTSIRGAGTVGTAALLSGAMSFVNNGSISADANAATLALNAPGNGGSYTNNGLFEARNGGTLQIGADLAQGAGGVLQALDGSRVRLSNVTVSGGTLQTAGTGAILATNTSNNLLRNVTLAGVVDLASATSQLRVGDGLAFSSGSIDVGSSTLYFDNRSNQGLAANQTLSGTGAITVAGGNIRFETATPAQTTIASGVSISGHGNLGAASLQSGQHTLINNGLISANSSGNTLVLQPIANGAQPVQNNGILEATSGGTLRLDADVVGGAGSQLRANTGSTIRMNGVTVSGVVNTTGGGTVTASNSSTNLLSNVTLNGIFDMSAAAGQLRVGNGLTMQAGSSILVGASTLYFDNRSNQGLAANQTLSGTGAITVAGGNIRFETATPAQTTIASGVSVSGHGNLGAASLQSGQHTLINNGLISANSSGNTLVLQPIANGAQPVQNNGILEATGGGTLRLDADVVGGAGSQLRANAGSTIRMNGVTVSGVVNTTGGGTVTASNTSTNLLSNVTLAGVVDLAAGPAQLRIANGLAFSGGTINVGSSTLYLDNRVSPGLAVSQVLSGNGSITLAGGAIRMEGASPAQTTLGSGVTIAGHGVIGAAALLSGSYALVNNGTIAASTSGQTLTLQPFANGNGALSGTGRLQVAGGTLAMTLGQASMQGVLDIASTGSFVMNAQNLTLNTDYINAQWGSGNGFNRRAGVTGAGQIRAGGDVTPLITGAGVTGGNTSNATLSIGNVRLGTTVFNYQVANGGSSGPTLRGAIQTSVNGANLSDPRLGGAGASPGLFNAGAPGSSSGDLGVSFTVLQAGPIAPLAGQVLNFRSNFDNIADQRLNIVVGAGAAAYQAAVGVATPAPIVLAAQRVGGTVLQALNISNLPAPGAPSGFSEDLNASFGTGSGAAVGSGSVSGLLAGASNGSAMTVGLNTATAGVLTGSVVVQFQTAGTVAGVANGLGVAPVGSQTIAVSGHVYAPAVPVLNTPSVNFGIVRVGDTAAPQAVNVANNASGALTDTLRASLSGGPAPFSAGGTASGIAAGSSNGSALTVSLNTSTAGVYSGSGTVSFTSQNPEMADLPQGSATLGFSAQVNNLAASALAHSGAGSFSGGLLSYTLDFGTVVEGLGGGTALLSLANMAVGPADALAGSLNVSALQPGDPFALGGFLAFSGLQAGNSLNGLSISFGGSVLGSFDRVITLNTLSTNGSGPDLPLAAVELRLLGTVAPIPEPGTWAMWLAGLAALGGLLRRRTQAAAALA